ncbi:FecR family protein [Povalibacter sp.]|uniref:FecR family protein n=1 Tax=Povalibacter sp. TaxID=1962978 RepID=UPI002F427220
MTHDKDSATSVTEQAAHWWVVFHSDGASPGDHREFAEWVARSPERVEAYLRTARVQQALKSGDVQWPTDSAADLIREARQSPQEPVPLSGATVVSLPRTQRPRAIAAAPVTWGLAATVMFGIGAAWFMLDRPQHFQTKFGEQRSVLLDDGSHVTLNTASEIEVRFEKDHRRIRLVQGEALFDVAHDAARPFDVEAGNTVLRAVGTQFDVDKRSDRTTVTVVEGRVAVLPATELPGVELPTLAANDRLVISGVGPHVLERGTNIAAATAWTQRRLIFEQRPLGEVAEEFNRYNRARIDIADAGLRQEQITGVFKPDDAASFLSFLSDIPGALIREDGHGGYIVTLDADNVAGT